MGILNQKPSSLVKIKLTGFINLKVVAFIVVFLIFLKTSGSVIGKFAK